MTIGTLAKRTGRKVETIRYYEKVGLLPEPARSEGGHRLYSNEHLKQLSFIVRSRELGFSVEEIRQLLKLAREHEYTCQQVYALAMQHLESIRDKIADLRRMEEVLITMSDQCTAEAVPDCPIMDALFKSAYGVQS